MPTHMHHIFKDLYFVKQAELSVGDLMRFIDTKF